MNKILEIKFGSHLYGTNTPNSDLDLKGIYLPTAKEICLNNYKKTITTTRPKQQFERNNKDDVDIEIFSLDRFVELLVDGQAVALDMLFAPRESYTQLDASGLMYEIGTNRNKFISKSMTSAFFGYAKQQAAKYGLKGHRVAALRLTLEWIRCYPQNIKISECESLLFVEKANSDHIKIVQCKGPNNTLCPHIQICDKKYPFHVTVKYLEKEIQRKFEEYGKRALMAEKNEGVDWKALSHAVRVNSQAKELLSTGFITFPRPDKELLLKIKTGQMDYKDVAIIIENGLEELKQLEKTSVLPEAPDMEFVNNFIYNIYSNIVKND